MFFTNAVPHFVKGICGDRFPTPFAKRPGKGQSSPTVNVLWALLNLLLGTPCCGQERLRLGTAYADDFLLGHRCNGHRSSVIFAKKDGEPRNR